MSSSIADLVAALTERVSGPVCVPGDTGFGAEIAAHNLATTHRPDVAVGATSAEDVVGTVRVAREHGYPIHVQNTGHGADAPIVGGVLLSTRRLDQLSIDPTTRIATIGAGARWAAVVAAAAEHGLAPITGSSPTVGCVGYLAGGGLGPLARSHGFSSDYVAGLTVVTGQGDLLDVSAKDHPDLLWAYRGGKTVMGIVVTVRVRLVELRTLYGGSLMFADGDIERALRTWVDWKDSAPADVTTSIAIMRFPPFETIPPPLRGRRLLSIRFGYPGAAAEGERLAAPLRAAAPVYMDMLDEMPTTQVGRIHSDPPDPAPSWLVGALLQRVDQAFASALLSLVGPGTDSALLLAEVRHVGSATRRDVPEGSAVSGRGVDHTIMLIAADPGRFGAAAREAAAFSQSIRTWIAAESNPNFPVQPGIVTSTAGTAPTERMERLAKIRAHYDPDRIFA